METADISSSSVQSNDDNCLIDLEEYDDEYYENYFKMMTQNSVYDGPANDYKHQKMSEDRKAYWENMDRLISDFVKQNPVDHYLAQKRSEEIFNVDYDDPVAQCKRNELNAYGKEVWKDVRFNEIPFEELTEHEVECLKVHLNTDDVKSFIQEYFNSQE